MKAIDVLMVENDPETVERTRESLRRSRILLGISTVRDCGGALEFLKKTEPDMVLLDMDMLCHESEALLDRLGDIPLVILTDSRTQKELMTAYRTGAACYVTKPLGLQQMHEIVEHVEGLWFSVVKEPGVKSGGP